MKLFPKKSKQLMIFTNRFHAYVVIKVLPYLLATHHGTCSEITRPSLMKDTPSVPRVLTITASMIGS